MRLEKYRYYKPTLGECWLLTVIFISANILISLILSVLGLASLATKYTSLSYILVAFVPLIFIYICAKRAQGYAFDKPVALNKPSFGKVNTFIFFALMLVAPAIISVIIDPLGTIIPMPEIIKNAFENIYNGTPLWDTLLATTIMAPLFEEFFCRGIMLRGMLENNVKPGKAIFWSSLIFAVIHLNPWQGLPAFVLALFFGWIYYRTRCLWATIFLHFVNNFSSIMLARAFPDMDVDAALCQILPLKTFIIFLIAALIAISGIIYYLNKNLPKNEKTKETISA